MSNTNSVNPELPGALPIFRDHVIAVLKKHFPLSRWYALTETDLAALSALAAAWWERERGKDPRASLTREALREFLEPIVPQISGMLQRRPRDPAKLPEWPVDPLTKQPVAIKDATSRNLLARENPDLWEAIKRREKSGGVFTYKQLLEDQQAAEEAKLVRDLEYGETQHASNPYRNGSLTARSDFARANPKPIVDYYKLESETKIRVPWLESNLTDRMNLAKNQQLNELLPRTRELMTAWGHEALEQVQKAGQELAQREEAAQRLLATK
jgi:hypothetical protein